MKLLKIIYAWFRRLFLTRTIENAESVYQYPDKNKVDVCLNEPMKAGDIVGIPGKFFSNGARKAGKLIDHAGKWLHVEMKHLGRIQRISKYKARKLLIA